MLSEKEIEERVTSIRKDPESHLNLGILRFLLEELKRAKTAQAYFLSEIGKITQNYERELSWPPPEYAHSQLKRELDRLFAEKDALRVACFEERMTCALATERAQWLEQGLAKAMALLGLGPHAISRPSETWIGAFRNFLDRYGSELPCDSSSTASPEPEKPPSSTTTS